MDIKEIGMLVFQYGRNGYNGSIICMGIYNG